MRYDRATIMRTQTAPARRFPRYRAALDVVIYQGSATRPARITQISRGGCLVFPPFPSQEKPDVKLSFRLSEELPPINCKGEAVHTIRDQGTGVAFTEIALHNQELITSFFESQLAGEKPK